MPPAFEIDGGLFNQPSLRAQRSNPALQPSAFILDNLAGLAMTMEAFHRRAVVDGSNGA
jgi:hypothetical protein